MFRRFLLALAVVSPLVNILPAHGADVPVRHYLMSCLTTPDIECIESITITSHDQLRVTQFGPSRLFTATGDLNPVDTREEWSFPGFSFEGSSMNRVVPRIVLRPLGSEQCAFGVCVAGLEEMQIGLEATWIYVTPQEEISMQMDLSRRGSQYLCGDKSNPRTCRRSFNFNQDLNFEIKLRIPTEFKTSAILGSVKNLSFKELPEITTIKGLQYRNIILGFTSQRLQKVLFSDFVPHPMDTSQYADYEGDSVNFWLLGGRSSQVTGLGKCAQTPFITVLSDSVFQSLPRWNPSESAIEVDLQAPHFNVDGTIHKGYFEATISKAMGKCLWGIDLSTKSTAKMSITYSGESGQEVQTVSGRFDGENYILFSANFHYSSPKISLKMQDAQTAPTRAAEAKSKSITCIKGKVKRVITSQAPKCPTGYKAK